MSDHDPRGGRDRRSGRATITLQLQSTADLAPARRRLRTLFDDAAVGTDAADASVLAVSELLTNALEAADPDTIVTARATVRRTPDRDSAGRRIEVDILNSGEPIPDRFDFDPEVALGHLESRGRGLAVAALVGEVTLEGLVGGTRARFRRTDT